MKKNKMNINNHIVMTMIIVITVIMLVSCNSKKSDNDTDEADNNYFYWFSEYTNVDVRVDIDETSSFGTCIPYIYTGDNYDISLVDINGTNVELANVSVFDDTFFDVKNVSDDVYKLGILGIRFSSYNQGQMEINDITLTIGGTKQTINLKNPFKIEFYQDSQPVFSTLNRVMTIGFDLEGVNGNYSFYNNGEYSLLKCNFRNYFNLDNLKVNVNDTEYNNINEKHIEKTDSINISMNILQKTDYEYSYILTSFDVTYIAGEKTLVKSIPMNRQAIVNKESGQKIFDLMVKKLEDINETTSN